MNEYDVKRLALVLAVQAEIEAMKVVNLQRPDDPPYKANDFNDKAHELRSIAHAHNEQLHEL